MLKKSTIAHLSFTGLIIRVIYVITLDVWRSYMPEKHSIGSIKSINKAIAILELLNESGRPLRIMEICSELGLSQSVTSRMVATLAAAGYLETDRDTGQIHLGLGLSLLGSAAVGRRNLDQVALPFIAEFAAQHEEWVSLSRLCKGKVVTMRAGASPSLVRDMHLMVVLPVHASAPGKALLAWRPDEEVRDVLNLNGMDPYTAQTITDPDRFMEDLAVVREKGVALDNCELLHELRHLATPIRDHSDTVVAALSAGGEAERITGDYATELGNALATTALHISRRLGYRAQAG